MPKKDNTEGLDSNAGESDIRELTKAMLALNKRLDDMEARTPNEEVFLKKAYTVIATDLVGKLDERIGKLTSELGAQVNNVVEQKTTAITQGLANQLTGIRDGLSAKIDERLATLGAPAPVEDTPGIAVANTGNPAVNPFFEIGRGIISGLAESIGKFEPILKLVIPQKQPDMGMLIDNYTRLHRYEAAGGNIDELKKIVTGQP